MFHRILWNRFGHSPHPYARGGDALGGFWGANCLPPKFAIRSSAWSLLRLPVQLPHEICPLPGRRIIPGSVSGSVSGCRSDHIRSILQSPRIRAAATGRVEHPLLTQLTDFPKLFLVHTREKKLGKVCQLCQCRAPGARAPARTHRGRGEGRITSSVRLHIVDFPADLMP